MTDQSERPSFNKLVVDALLPFAIGTTLLLTAFVIWLVMFA